MPVDPANSDHHGGGNYTIIIWCPAHVGERFVHFDRTPTSGSWVIRDYIAGQQLSNHDSPLTIAQIEAATQRDEFPPFHPETQRLDWEAYLRLRSMAVSRQHGVPYSAAPNASPPWRLL